MDLAGTFDSVAAQYEASRPGYPPALFAELAASVPGRRALEIGPGTGQATRGLVASGFGVDAVEPGASLAAVLRSVLPEVAVHVTPFESYEGAPGSFDLVFAATSWHWVDPAVAFPRAASLLAPGGSLAIVSTFHVFPADGDPFFRAVQADYEAAGLSDGSTGPPPPDEVSTMDFGPPFPAPVERRYLTAITYTADEYLALLSTYSNHIAAGPTRLYADVRRRIGAGTVRKHYLTTLQIAPLPPRP